MSGVILLVDAKDEYAALLRRSGFTVEIAAGDTTDTGTIVATRPALVAVQLDTTRSAETLETARLLRAHPQLRNTPIVVFAAVLDAKHIEEAARSGLLWLQLNPVDKLVAAVRGLLSATEGAARSSANRLRGDRDDPS